jgi:hypothetical protein
VTAGISDLLEGKKKTTLKDANAKGALKHILENKNRTFVLKFVFKI